MCVCVCVCVCVFEQLRKDIWTKISFSFMPIKRQELIWKILLLLALGVNQWTAYFNQDDTKTKNVIYTKKLIIFFAIQSRGLQASGWSYVFLRTLKLRYLFLPISDMRMQVGTHSHPYYFLYYLCIYHFFFCQHTIYVSLMRVNNFQKEFCFNFRSF